MVRNHIRVLAKMTSRPEKADELESVLLELLKPTRKERGCLSYQLYRNNANVCEFVLVEEWENDASLAAHLDTTHIQDALMKAKPLLAKMLDVRKYTELEVVT
jgi:quinol monooxygenase YgiN